jgi:hypothetical protein
MFSALLWLFIGLMLGWFFLPTPEWATRLITAVVAKVPFLAPFLKK